jgi:hypothetical protein
MPNIARIIDADHIETSIRLLKTYLEQSADTEALLSALEALRAEPQSDACLTQFTTAFRQHKLQGAVLTYAPYIITLLSDDPFD